MSTKSSLSYRQEKGDHKLNWHVYEDMHQVQGTMVFEFTCSTCYCGYKFLMDKHLGEQLARILKQHEEDKL